MTGLSTITAATGTTLCLDLASGRVIHLDTLPPSRVAPLFALGSPDEELLMIVAIEPVSTRPVYIRRDAWSCGSLLTAKRSGEFRMLRSIAVNLWLSAAADDRVEADLVTAADAAAFKLAPAPYSEMRPFSDLMDLFAFVASGRKARRPWLEILQNLLSQPASPAAAALIEEIWPLLPVEDFDQLVSELRYDDEIFRHVARLYPTDFWANRSLLSLQHWISAREMRDGRIRQISPTAAFGIGTDFDGLASAGFNGRLSSFPHACNAAMRLQTKPVRGPAIVATARSEGVYLLEWIAYHRLIGIEAFYIYTNNNEEGSDSLLSALHVAGVITWIRSEMAPGVSAQNKAYGHALNVLLPVLDHRWAAFIDIDEFIVLDPTRFGDIREFAGFHERRETDAIALTWVMVGSSGATRWSDAPLTTRNTHLRVDPHHHIKALLSPRHFIQSHPHFPFADRRRNFTFRLASGKLHEHRNQPADAFHAQAFSDEPAQENACIYHYFFKSLEEFVWKSCRNRGDFPMSPETDFQGMDSGSVQAFLGQHTSDDYFVSDRIRACAPGLEEEIERLRHLPRVRDAEAMVIKLFRTRIAELRRRLLTGPKLDGLGPEGAVLRSLLEAQEV